MNIFLVVVRKGNPAKMEIDLDKVRSFLPVMHDAEASWSGPNNVVQLYSFSYWPGQIRSASYIHAGESAALTFDGFPDLPDVSVESDLPNQILRMAQAHGPQAIRQVSGENSLVYVDDKTVYATSNIGATHPLFFTENDQLIALTNWMGLLLGLPGVDDAWDLTGLSWLCYERSIDDNRTPFEMIKKIPPGSFVVASPSHGLSITPQEFGAFCDEAISEAYARDPLAAFEECSSWLISYVRRAYQFYKEPPVWIQLSGGKDSRLLLGLLKASGLLEKITRVETRGHLYSPDVLSAQQICEVLGGLPQKIARPRLRDPDAQTQADKITNQILAFQGCFSLYDLGGVGPMSHLRLDMVGHQYILRDTFFRNCRTTSLSEFIEDVFTMRPHDPFKILRQKVRESFAERYGAFFQSYVAEGVPLADLDHLYMLRQRAPSWVILHSNRCAISRPHHNPLLHGNLARFVFSIPIHVRRAELFHFTMMQLCAPELLDIPFADDTWPDELQQYVLGGFHVPVTIPYHDLKVYRRLKAGRLPDERARLLEDLTPVLQVFLEKHKRTCEGFIDIEAARHMLLQPKQAFRPVELKCGLGLGTVLLLMEYGKAMFLPHNREAIAADIRDRLKVTGSQAKVNVARQGVDDLLENQERCIAELACEQRIRLQTEHKVRRFYSSHDHFVGCFDFMHINGYRVITKGWALSPNGSKPGDEVVIVNSRHEIVAFAQVGEPRDDVSANLDNDALRMCGWRASFELGPDQCESDKFFYAFVFEPQTQDAYALKNWFRFNQGQFEKVKRSRTGFV